MDSLPRLFPITVYYPPTRFVTIMLSAIEYRIQVHVTITILTTIL
jgi:hypothetical protein